MNNLFATAAAGLLGLFGVFGGHGNIAASTSHDFDNGTTTQRIERELHSGTTTKPTVNISCVAAAVAAREASIDTAVSTYTGGINTAYTTRASALASAYALTGNDAIRTAVKAAWKQFTTSAQGAKRAWQKSRENSWATFRTAVKACGPGATAVVDMSGSGSEISGQ